MSSDIRSVCDPKVLILQLVLWLYLSLARCPSSHPTNQAPSILKDELYSAYSVAKSKLK